MSTFLIIIYFYYVTYGASGTHKQIEIKYAFIDPFIGFLLWLMWNTDFFKWT